MPNLLSNLGKRGVNLGLDKIPVDIEDTTYLSKYFVVAEFNPIFTAGRNSIAFNGSPFLKNNFEIQVQCLDSNNNSLYLEFPKSKTQFADVANFVVSIHVYNENYNGPGKLILVGTTTNNQVVRWISNISIDKTLQNISKTRFYATPTLEARSLLYPVIDSSVGTSLSMPIVFTGSFYSYAQIPSRDTIQSYINPKKTDVDYRLFYNPVDLSTVGSQVYPTASFNSQMEKQTIVLTTNIIQTPFSYLESKTQVSASFTIKKVIDSKTIQLSDAFFYKVGKDNVVTNINVGQFTASYKWVSYNTSSDTYQKYVPPSGPIVFAKESYAEITYRNIQPFTGFVARHKLYRKSLVYPGDFVLISDEPLGTRELLIDPITSNKSYASMGIFYNQFHINKYWFSSSNDLPLIHAVTPHINSMTIGRGTSFNNIDGTKYVIIKTDSVDSITNDFTYYPYTASQFNELQGTSYNSNFIDLKSGSLYVLSTNLSIQKDTSNLNSKLTFYFTSSSPSISKEQNYIPQFGLKVGEILLQELVDIKNYVDKQLFYFTPSNDYFGTLVVVPYQCNCTLSDVSLGIYGDYGFSPDTLITKIPFDINIAGEPFHLKAELFDINSTLIYSNLETIQTFDPNGESLFVFIPGSNFDPTKVTKISGSLTISQSLFLPNIKNCPVNIRLLGYTLPVNSPPSDTDGAVCFTNISDVSVNPTNPLTTLTTDDYINIGTVNGLTNHNGKSLAIKYVGNGTQGRKIYINSSGIKTIYQ